LQLTHTFCAFKEVILNSYPEYLKNLEAKFVWRRAFRSPSRSVTRSDLLQAFDMSGNTASALLTGQAKISNGLLVRDGNRIVAPAWAASPHMAGEEDLMDHLGRGMFEMCFTGLTMEELPINRATWTENLPMDPGALETIVQCIGKKRSLFIHYISMARGDFGKWRRVLPLALDCIGTQWRMVGQDLGNAKDAYPIRTFVLARIEKVKPDDEALPKKLIRASGLDSIKMLPIQCNGELNDAQKRAMEHELGIRKNAKQILLRSIYEFRLQYGDASLSEKAIWPPIRSVKEGS
jgi:hypothetical protein